MPGFSDNSFSPGAFRDPIPTARDAAGADVGRCIGGRGCRRGGDSCRRVLASLRGARFIHAYHKVDGQQSIHAADSFRGPFA